MTTYPSFLTALVKETLEVSVQSALESVASKRDVKNVGGRSTFCNSNDKMQAYLLVASWGVNEAVEQVCERLIRNARFQEPNPMEEASMEEALSAQDPEDFQDVSRKSFMLQSKEVSVHRKDSDLSAASSLLNQGSKLEMEGSLRSTSKLPTADRIEPAMENSTTSHKISRHTDECDEPLCDEIANADRDMASRTNSGENECADAAPAYEGGSSGSGIPMRLEKDISNLTGDSEEVDLLMKRHEESSREESNPVSKIRALCTILDVGTCRVCVCVCVCVCA
jgi:hypothetical protein